MKVSGQLEKMTHEAKDPIEYFLSLDARPVPINPAIGKTMTIKFTGIIACVECGRKIKKTYSDGYCFPCMRDLPENAMCSVRPETCEHEHGNEADQEFYRTRCNVAHFVYLSLTSGVKVGVTRHTNIPSRWIDQGAVQGLIIAKVPERKLAGLIEVALAKNMADKTNWRKMLKGDILETDLPSRRDEAIQWIPEGLKKYAVKDEQTRSLRYPIQAVPGKIVSHNLDKEAEFTDRLTGIKGQYLIFANRVINLRKYSGYHIEFTVDG